MVIQVLIYWFYWRIGEIFAHPGDFCVAQGFVVAVAVSRHIQHAEKNWQKDLQDMDKGEISLEFVEGFLVGVNEKLKEDGA